MLKTIINKSDYKSIQRFGSNGYMIHYNPINQEEDNILCDEDTIFVTSNTKENLIQSIIDYKYPGIKATVAIGLGVANPKDTKYLEYIDWKEYAKKCASIIFDVPTLENAIKAKLEEINKYDVSSAVNGFYYQGNEYWLDKATRVGLMNSTRILKENGQTITTLWFDNKCLTLPVDDVIDKLSALEQYALNCYNVTASHKNAVQALTTIEEVNEYDITQDYPIKLDLT